MGRRKQTTPPRAKGAVAEQRATAGARVSIHTSQGKTILVNEATRLADVVSKLKAAGRHGVSVCDFPPSVRLGGIVFKLRQLGVAIESQRWVVPSDPFGMRVAVYRLAGTIGEDCS
jgi:hypothetical protein